MFASSLQYKPLSDEDLRCYENEHWAEMTKVLEQHAAVVKELMEVINTCLFNKQDGWLQTLFDIVSSSAYQKVKSGRDELLVLERVCNLAEREGVERKSILFEVSSVSDVFELYYRTVFYIRRFEMKLADELCKEIIPFMEEWKITPEYLLMVMESDAIIDWNGAGNRLSNFFLQYGYSVYGQAILTWMLDKIAENS